MARTSLITTVEFAVPPQLVWSVMAEVEQWPEWTSSVRRAKLLTPGPLLVGSRVRLRQPGFPSAWWRVTALEPNGGFTWVNTAPGLRVIARHRIESLDGYCRVVLSVSYEGLLGPLLARWTGNVNDRYPVIEAKGLKARCVATFTSPSGS